MAFTRSGWRYSQDLITDDDVPELISRQNELNYNPGEKFLYATRDTHCLRRS